MEDDISNNTSGVLGDTLSQLDTVLADGLEHIQDGRSVLAAFGTPLEEQAVDGSQRWNPKSLSIMVEKAKDERFQVQGKAQGKARKRLVEQNRKQKMQEKNI